MEQMAPLWGWLLRWAVPDPQLVQPTGAKRASFSGEGTFGLGQHGLMAPRGRLGVNFEGFGLFVRLGSKPKTPTGRLGQAELMDKGAHSEERLASGSEAQAGLHPGPIQVYPEHNAPMAFVSLQNVNLSIKLNPYSRAIKA